MTQTIDATRPFCRPTRIEGPATVRYRGSLIRVTLEGGRFGAEIDGRPMPTDFSLQTSAVSEAMNIIERRIEREGK